MRYPETAVAISTNRESGRDRKHTRRRGRGTGAAALVLLAAAGVTACSSSNSLSPNTSGSSSAAGPATPGTKAPGSTAPSSAATTPAATKAPTPPASPTAEAGPAGCTTNELEEDIIDPNGAAGTIYWTMTFKNVGGKVCTLYGYPGVSLVSTHQIGEAANRNPGFSPKKLVPLAPGQTAYAELAVTEAGNYPPDRCTIEGAAGFMVYAPNTVEPYMIIKHGLQGCAPGTTSEVDLLTVGTVTADKTW